MIAFLLDTLLATGALIALVLVLRKPVARVFGPGLAYALWLLPLLRFVMPPVLLPASLAPRAAEPIVTAAEAAAMPPPEAVIPMVSPVPVESFDAAPVAAVEPDIFAALPWGEILMGLWLGVALGFLAWRFVTYRAMRRELLADARPVGETGKVRLVETPAVTAPVAFGMIDKVIALPMGFMALEDREARDFAIAHELAHHRGRDLAANILAQPLLALHWFNPLAWLAWRAMRRDQEAACDARVLAERGRAARVRYARVIAGFAAGPRLALAAPMACPVLGEKSIIHRLRSLKMDDVSRRRRLLGRGLVIAGSLALPLTATVTYAATELPDPPEPPAAPQPAAAPEAPLPPDAPEAREEDEHVHTFVLRRTDGDGEPEVRTFSWSGRGPVPPVPGVAPVPVVPHFEFHGWGDPSDPDFEKKMEEWGKRMEEWGEKYGERYAEQAEAQAKAWSQHAPQAPMVVHSCDGNPQEVARHETTDDGRQKIVICQKVAKRQARNQSLWSLRNARNAIARDRNMRDEVRSEVLEELDEEIERIQNDSDDG